MSNIELVVKSGNNLPDILKGLLPAVVAQHPTSVDIPKAVKVTPAIASATTTLQLTTVGHESLTVFERRSLTPEELDTLSSERDALDVMAKYIKGRLEAHKAMVFNHFDVRFEETGVDVDADGEPVSLDGVHYVVPATEPVQGGSRKFVRQVSKGAPLVTAQRLDEVAEAGDVEGFDHKAYLACTTPVRQLDEEKTLIEMRSNPAVLDALRKAVKPGGKSASLYHRPG